MRKLERKMAFSSYTYHKVLQVVLVFSFFATFLCLFRPLRVASYLATTHLKVKSRSFCDGRYIYVQELPPRFNQDLLQHCETVFTSWTDRNMCPHLANQGIGSRVKDSETNGVLTNGSWYLTNSYSLSVIFHNRMNSYECLTNDSSMASAVYVPYYAGLDASRNLWTKSLSIRDKSAKEFVEWLKQTPEWKRMWGMDHFFVSGRTGWDFRREWGSESSWGTRLRLLPESSNMSMLSMESTIWNNDYAIPYPTSFHPSHDLQVFEWQEMMRSKKRQYLFSFAGGPRAKNPETLRAKVIEECHSHSGSCKLLSCNYSPDGSMKCDHPSVVMELHQNSVFCLQPRGDSFTRRSFFDSILAGCIPVLFHPGSAYIQYSWYLPKDHDRYSVYIPVENEKDWRPGNVTATLQAIPGRRVEAMREEVIRLIPSIIYSDPRFPREKLEDAFDVAVKGILTRIQRVRDEVSEGRDPTVGFAEKDTGKFLLSRYAG